jgi:phosphoribosylformylglycinamidine cyclo-ligase
LCLGARPLFLLDYIGIHRIEKELIAQIAEGLAEGCSQAECALVGGETAELNDLYRPGDYDLVGFGVGVVDRERIIDGSKIQSGDRLVALGSSGIHSNGYSLVRKIIDKRFGGNYEAEVPELPGGLLETILEPTKIYVKSVLRAIDGFDVRGVAHITGGGIPENLPRVLPEGLTPSVDWDAIHDPPPIFSLLKEWGPVETKEMRKTFNMGVGMILVVPKHQAAEAVSFLSSQGEKAFEIGEIVAG